MAAAWLTLTSPDRNRSQAKSIRLSRKVGEDALAEFLHDNKLRWQLIPVIVYRKETKVESSHSFSSVVPRRVNIPKIETFVPKVR